MRQILWIPFDYDRKLYTPKLEWVISRHSIFRDFTLRSLLAQTHTAFTIALLCGQRHRALTESLEWHSRVRLVHDEGRALLREIAADGDEFAGFTRLDSDDLMNIGGIKWIEGLCEKMKDAAKVVSFVCNRNLYWDRINVCLGRHHRLCQPPPFVTRIVPCKVLADYDAWRKVMFLGHGREMKLALNPTPIGENIYCVVKHGTNTSRVRRDQDHPTNTPEEMADLMRRKKLITIDPGQIAAILKSYGITPEMVMRTPDVEFRGGEFIEPEQKESA